MNYGNLVLVLEVCPHCERHGTVLVKDGEVTVKEFLVITKQNARLHNQFLLERGGVNQEDFLAQVAASTLPESTEAHGPMSGAALLTFLLGGFGGAVRVWSVSRELDVDYSGGKLSLRQCGCGQHGQIYMELPGYSPRYVERVFSKRVAGEFLAQLISCGLPEQPEFEAQVAAASWLQGEMPAQP